MKTVYTKEEFKKAFEAKESKIIVRGQLANEIKKKNEILQIENELSI